MLGSKDHCFLKIRNIDVLFPKQPYEPQIAYMEQGTCCLSFIQLDNLVIDALNGAKNALLQSPTGTGKTLCLLSATLAWNYHNMKNSMPTKKIYYATRTLSQMKQVPLLLLLFKSLGL